MSDIDHAKTMLSLASCDLIALKGMLDPNVFAENIFGFHAQQSVEKTLKAWISALGGTYPYIHDIEELIKILRSMNNEALIEALYDVNDLEDYVDLNPYGVQFRYTEYDIFEEVLDRTDIIDKVQSLFNKVNGIIGEIERQI